MRLPIVAAVAAFLMAAPAMAQTETTTPPGDTAPLAQSECGAAAPAPADLPDGASATRAQLEAATERFNAWAAAQSTHLACRRAEAQAAMARADSLARQYNELTRAGQAASAAWQAEVEEFNARNQRRR